MHENKAKRSCTQISSRSHTATGMNSVIHYSLVHIPMPQAFKNSRFKDSSGARMGKLETILAWQLTRVRNKKEVIDDARNNGRRVRFASLMELSHLKTSELEPQYLKYKGRVVLRGDIGKS